MLFSLQLLLCSFCLKPILELIFTAVSGNCYNKAVGVTNSRIIPDNQITSSSQYGIEFQSYYGRLNDVRGGGWCAREANRTDDWLQIDLGKRVEVCAVATQGDGKGSQWVTDFMLSYSPNGISWVQYKDQNAADLVSINRSLQS